jgi:hypothetical protein
MHSAPIDGAWTPRLQVRRYLPEKQWYTVELMEPRAGGGGAGQNMDVRPANFVLVHVPAGTRCARGPGPGGVAPHPTPPHF